MTAAISSGRPMPFPELAEPSLLVRTGDDGTLTLEYSLGTGAT